MAIEGMTKFAMALASLGAADITINHFIPSISINGLIMKIVPTAYQKFNWIIFTIYGFGAIYTIYKVFSK